MDIDTRTLRTFCAVVQTGSFTRAAHRLGYSQSSVTSQMRALEREIGQQVFQRLPTGVRLTQAGTTLRTYARQLLTLAGELEESLRGPSFTTPRITVGLVPALAYGEQLARIAHFGRLLLPDVQLALRVQGTADLHAALRAGDLDGAILLAGTDPADRPEPSPASTSASPSRRVTASVRAAMLADRARAGRSGTGERHELDNLLEISVQQLEFGPVIGLPQCRPTTGRLAPSALRQVVVADPGCPSQRWLPEFLRLRTGEPPESLELGSMDGVHATVQAGLGCAMLPTELSSARPGTGLLPLPGVPRMTWNVSLLALRSRSLQDSHRHGLAEAVRHALSPGPLRTHGTAAGTSAGYGRGRPVDAATGAA